LDGFDGFEDFSPDFSLVFFSGLGISRPVGSCAKTQADNKAAMINSSRGRQKEIIPTPIIALYFQSKPDDGFSRRL
jgi:hypothetical protein